MTVELVVDASVAVSWVLRDEQDESSRRIMADLHDGRARLVVPELWRYEVLNAIGCAVRRERLTRDEALAAVRSVWTFSGDFVSFAGHGASDILRTALDTGLTVYDAAYVALARERGADLVTRDKQFLKLSCPGVRILSPDEYSP